MTDDPRDCALVAWDALQLGRRTAVIGMIPEIVRLAVAEVRPRHEYGSSTSEWVTRVDTPVVTLECLFCRELLHEVRRHQPSNSFSLEPEPSSAGPGAAHCERCAVGVIAGIVKVVAAAEVRAPRARDIERLPRQLEMSPCQGDPNYGVSVTIWGSGFARKRIVVTFAGRRATVLKRISDHEILVEDPYAGSPGELVDVVVRVGRVVTKLRQKFGYCTPSPY